MNYKNSSSTMSAGALAVYAHDSPEAMSALTRLFQRHRGGSGQGGGLRGRHSMGDRVATVGKISGVKDQPDSIVGSLDLFLRRRVKRKQMSVVIEHSSQALAIDEPATFDYLIVTRYDVKLLSPIVSWPCYDKPLQVSAASQCEPGAWARFNCIADHFWIVPRAYVPRFSNLVGSRLNLSHYTKCCFAKRCLQKAGHGCYNVLTHHLGGLDRVGFCWCVRCIWRALPSPLLYTALRASSALPTSARVRVCHEPTTPPEHAVASCGGWRLARALARAQWPQTEMLTSLTA
jgi:hypothetical protein